MTITRSPSRPVFGSPVYSPSSLPAYRGGGQGGGPVPQPVCSYPLSGDIAASLGRDPLLVLGANSQVVTADLTSGKSVEQFAAGAVIAHPEAGVISWVEAQDLVFGSRALNDQTPFIQIADGATMSVVGLSLSKDSYGQYAVHPAHSGGVYPPTNLTCTANSKVSIGLDSLGKVYWNVDGVIEKVDTAVTITQGAGVIFFTAYTDGLVPAASMRLVTDAADFTNTYPAVAGISLMTDLCGKEI